MNRSAIDVLFKLLLCICLMIIGNSVVVAETPDLSFKAKTNKETFVLGEPLEVEFVFFNGGESSAIVPSGGVEVGSLEVFVARQNQEYEEYFASGWGRLTGYRKTLAPKQSYSYKATILWNGKPNVSHLNEDTAKQILKGKITTEYALPEPGVYWIKGVSYIGENATLVESEPVAVTVNAPVDDDLKIWNQIKGNREIAFLMQKGGFDTDKDKEKEYLISTVEQIILQYPNSAYSSCLKPKLEEYKLKEKKRDEFYRKIRLP